MEGDLGDSRGVNRMIGNKREFSAVAIAAELPLFHEEFGARGVCETRDMTWGIGVSGGVMRRRLNLSDVINMVASGQDVARTNRVILIDNDGDEGVDMDALPPNSMFG